MSVRPEMYRNGPVSVRRSETYHSSPIWEIKGPDFFIMVGRDSEDIDVPERVRNLADFLAREW